MNEYVVITKGRTHLQWFGNSVKDVREEAENCGHKVCKRCLKQLHHSTTAPDFYAERHEEEGCKTPT